MFLSTGSHYERKLDMFRSDRTALTHNLKLWWVKALPLRVKHPIALHSSLRRNTVVESRMDVEEHLLALFEKYIRQSQARYIETRLQMIQCFEIHFDTWTLIFNINNHVVRKFKANFRCIGWVILVQKLNAKQHECNNVNSNLKWHHFYQK